MDSALAALLSVLGCGTGHTSRVEVLECLVGYVQASLLVSDEATPNAVDDAHTSAAIRRVARLAGVDAGCDDASHVLGAVRAWLEPCLASLPASFFQPVVARDSLSESQMALLKQLDAKLSADYAQRRAALLARTRLALQAMAAAPRVGEEDSSERVEEIVAQMQQWDAAPAVSVEQLFTLTHGGLHSGLCTVCAPVTPLGFSSGQCLSLDPSQRVDKQGPSSFVRHVRIADVPDRGGRGDARKGTQGIVN